MVYQKKIQIQSDRRPTFHDVTDSAEKFILETKMKNGILVAFSQHTTCSVIIQEQSDDVNFWGTQLIHQDLVNGLTKLFPTCLTEGQYSHPGPQHIRIAREKNNEEAFWSLNTDAHLRSVLLGRSETIPVTDGELELGKFGRIYFVDFDQVRARERQVIFKLIGE